jgi:hypothetical protein
VVVKCTKRADTAECFLRLIDDSGCFLSWDAFISEFSFVVPLDGTFSGFIFFRGMFSFLVMTLIFMGISSAFLAGRYERPDKK